MFKPKINIKKELKKRYINLKKEHLTITCEGNDLSEGNNIIRFLRGEFDLNTIYYEDLRFTHKHFKHQFTVIR